MHDNIIIRSATIQDAEDILKIYGYYVLNTSISFDYEIPEISDFKRKIGKTLEKYPYLVAVWGNKIVGYAYAGLFVGREAYKFSAELTVYIDKDYQHRGIGKLLYKEMEKQLKEMGITNLYACIGTPVEEEDEYIDFNSVKFHEHLGFKQVGEFKKCGYKFDRFLNMVWMEKVIGTY